MLSDSDGGMLDAEVVDFLKSDMTWHKPTQGFSSSDNFFKVLWNNALNDGFDDSKFKDHFESSNKFKFDHNDIKAFGILLGRTFFGTHLNCSSLFAS